METVIKPHETFVEHTFKYKQIIVIRKDVEMSPAKLAVQVAHGAIESYQRTDPCIRDEWYEEGMRKVVLMIKSLEELQSLNKNVPCGTFIIDFGLTELEPNTITGIAFNILNIAEVPKPLKKLSLYR
jgi:peptidyl-tRNA hydrolase, PTH2 family